MYFLFNILLHFSKFYIRLDLPCAQHMESRRGYDYPSLSWKAAHNEWCMNCLISLYFSNYSEFWLLVVADTLWVKSGCSKWWPESFSSDISNLGALCSSSTSVNWGYTSPQVDGPSVGWGYTSSQVDGSQRPFLEQATFTTFEFQISHTHTHRAWGVLMG